MALTEGPTSPIYTGDGEDTEITYVYKMDKAENHEQYVPAKNSPNPEGAGYFRKWERRSQPGYDIFTRTYGKFLASGSYVSRKSGDTECEPSTNVLEKPLESSPNYRAKWNWDLYAATEALPVPAWWDTATDTDDDIVSGGASSGYLWAKSYPGEGWYKIKTRTKPGQEVFYVPSFTVVERTYYRKKTDAQAVLQTVATKVEPVEKFGYTTGEWLVLLADLFFDGKFWVATVTYQHADEWDSDLYS